ncbi:hypothetical protein GCM10010343_22550 [Streptomyces avidinii]|nr:hypothetical protein GCM10010343_22550 [Streptomyces avidinii]
MYWTYRGGPDNAARCDAGRRGPGKIRKSRPRPTPRLRSLVPVSSPLSPALALALAVRRGVAERGVDDHVPGAVALAAQHPYHAVAEGPAGAVIPRTSRGTAYAPPPPSARRTPDRRIVTPAAGS